MSDRRHFIKIAAAGTAGFVTLGSFAKRLPPKEDYFKLTILHTNDTHSRIEPFAKNHPKYPNQGGMARRATLIKRVRATEKNVLLLDAGDIFQGTPYFNYFGGELEFKLMSKMGYDVATIGNHDFDNGLEGLNKMLPYANFPFVNANYDFSKTILKEKFKPYTVLRKGDVKIGVFGLGVELDGLVDPKMYGNTIYLDPVSQANKIAKELKIKKKCDFVICLSHLGFKYEDDKIDDLKLAAKTNNIDLILGGHTHTFLEEPVVVKNIEEKDVYINQVGWAGINVGRLDFYFERKKVRNSPKNNLMKVE